MIVLKKKSTILAKKGLPGMEELEQSQKTVGFSFVPIPDFVTSALSSVSTDRCSFSFLASLRRLFSPPVFGEDKLW